MCFIYSSKVVLQVAWTITTSKASNSDWAAMLSTILNRASSQSLYACAAVGAAYSCLIVCKGALFALTGLESIAKVMESSTIITDPTLRKAGQLWHSGEGGAFHHSGLHGFPRPLAGPGNGYVRLPFALPFVSYGWLLRVASWP